MAKIITILCTAAMLLSGVTVRAASEESVINRINSAKDAYMMKKVVYEYAQELGIDTDSDKDRIFYPMPVYARMIGEYDSVSDFKEAFEYELSQERTAPKVILRNKNGEQLYSISRGSYNLFIDHGELSEPVTFVAAVYENGNMRKCVAMQSGVMNTTIELTGIKVGTGKTELRLFSLTGLDTLSVDDSWMYEFEKPKPQDGAYHIYLSPAGNDSAGGTRLHPVKTPLRAAELAKEITASADEDVVIELLGGEYFIDAPIELDSDNSGSNGHKIIWRGPEDKTALISGGKRISGWSLYKDGIYKAELDADDLRELYVNNIPAVRARTEGLLKGISSDRYGITVTKNDIPPQILSSPEGVELVFDILWNRHRILIDSISAASDTSTVRLNAVTPWYAYYLNSSANRPCDDSSASYAKTRYDYYIENALCLLDQPNEFYFDKSSKMLYYKPMTGTDIFSADIIAPYSEGLLSISGTQTKPVENISFENISFRYGTWLEPSVKSHLSSQAGQYWTENKSNMKIMPAQVKLTYAKNIEFINSDFSCLGSTAVSLTDGVINCSVSGCSFKYVEGALSIGSPSYVDVKPYSLKIMTTDITIKNNTVSDTGAQYLTSPAITVYHAKNVDVVYNSISDCSYSGISAGWGWNAATLTNTSGGGHNISYNRIERVLTISEDGAPIYTLGQMGNKVTIEGNYLNTSYDGSKQSPKTLGWHGGIYCDEGSSNVDIKGNVVENVYRWLYARPDVKLRNITAENNFCDEGSYIENDTRGIDMSKTDGVLNVWIKSHNVYPLSDRPEAVREIISAAGVQNN